MLLLVPQSDSKIPEWLQRVDLGMFSEGKWPLVAGAVENLYSGLGRPAWNQDSDAAVENYRDLGARASIWTASSQVKYYC
jgi:hypothetical protein